MNFVSPGQQPGYLFANTGVGEHIGGLQRKLQEEVAAWQPDELLRLSETDVLDYFMNKYGLECPVLHREQAALAGWEEVTRENRMQLGFGPSQVKLNRHRLLVPFTGSPEVFRLRPNIIQGSPPVAIVEENTLSLIWEGHHGTQDIRKVFDDELDRTEQWLSRLRGPIEQYSGQLEAFTRNAIGSRRQQILDALNVEESIGFPVLRTPEEANFAFPVTRKRIVPPMPAGEGPFAPEPTFAESDYEAALHLIANARHGFERSPKTTAKLQEEEIRDLLLIILNGHFEGAAGGELFNCDGKTDILIRAENRNVFIGECKFWGGAAQVEGDLSQLLGYMAWRDTKGAFLLFIKNKDVGAAITKAVEEFKKHPCFKRFIAEQPGERYDFLFRSTQDADREIRLALIPFAIKTN